jgi:hypothetical protein
VICVKLDGGLGNQMFQYAFGRKLAFQKQTSLILDASFVNTNQLKSSAPFRPYGLDIFHLNAKKATSHDLRKIKPIYCKILNSLSFRFRHKGIQLSNYFVENDFSYNTSIKKVRKNCYLSGYWQSPRYFQLIESIIRKDFDFPELSGSKNKELLSKIKNNNSISIHVRKTDFKTNNTHGTCPIEFYQKAVRLINTQLSSPFLFFFSDDMQWVRNNLDFGYPSKFISGNEDYVDMQLMSQCKHNIIANSSFSWWGAWLNNNPEKIVIAPERWFADTTMNDKTNTLIPKSWERL